MRPGGVVCGASSFAGRGREGLRAVERGRAAGNARAGQRRRGRVSNRPHAKGKRAKRQPQRQPPPSTGRTPPTHEYPVVLEVDVVHQQKARVGDQQEEQQLAPQRLRARARRRAPRRGGQQQAGRGHRRALERDGRGAGVLEVAKCQHFGVGEARGGGQGALEPREQRGVVQSPFRGGVVVPAAFEFARPRSGGVAG
jgi:hypothetical protein